MLRALVPSVVYRLSLINIKPVVQVEFGNKHADIHIINHHDAGVKIIYAKIIS